MAGRITRIEADDDLVVVGGGIRGLLRLTATARSQAHRAVQELTG